MNVTDPEEPISKKRKRNSKSRGGYRFPTSSGSTGEEELKQHLKSTETDLQIMTWLTNCGQCCGKVPEEASCCLLQQFKRNNGEYHFQVNCIFLFRYDSVVLQLIFLLQIKIIVGLL